MNSIAAKTLIDTPASPVEWFQVDKCPCCGAEERTLSALPESGYVFGDERIAFPKGGVSVATCPTCQLVYKTVLPAPTSLTQVFERQAGKKWMEPYDFRDEVAELQRIAGDGPLDLLDIGSGSGALLGAWSKRAQGGRCSALDVVQHPHCADHINGEFIRGLIDSELLRWSGQPYNIVTLFDVVEHLYSPQVAFRNLHKLVRNNGLVVIESGNVKSEWPARYGAQHWWYVRLFEHHMFWSRRSLNYIAARSGFKLLIWRELKHKTRSSWSRLDEWQRALQVFLYRASPAAYPLIATVLGKYWTQPWSPFARDHFRAVLRKI